MEPATTATKIKIEMYKKKQLRKADRSTIRGGSMIFEIETTNLIFGENVACGVFPCLKLRSGSTRVRPLLILGGCIRDDHDD